MKKHFPLILFLFISKIVFCQLPFSTDSLYKVIKERSIFRNAANWNTIEIGYKAKLQTAKTDIDSIKSIVFIFEQLNDYHSQVIYNNRQFANYPSFDDSTLQYLRPLVVRSQQQFGIIKTTLLQGKYVYVQVPGIQAQGQSINAYAKALSDSICQYNNKTVKGFIIDLRLNSGGQLSSMVAGLNLLAGDGYLGGGINYSNIETRKFELKSNNFHIANAPMTAIKNACSNSYETFPVVIIIGPATRSSGSITAIIFKQRKNTLFIGEPTADGYTTGNDYFYFGNNLMLNLSTEFNQDRKGIIYKNAVPPDLLIKAGDDFDNLSNDKKINAALEWLNKSSVK